MDKNFTEPVIFLSRGNEKEISKFLKFKALETVLEKPFELYTSDTGKPLVKYEKKIGISVSHDENTVVPSSENGLLFCLTK